MSSQKKGIPLSHVPDDIGYRLIELPPDLQSLLESDGAPVSVLIYVSCMTGYANCFPA